MNAIERIRMDKKTVRGVIYARFSSEMQREESIDAQLRAIKDYADKNGINIVGEYVDRAKSATTDQRPEFQNMIRDSKKGLFDVVLVHKLDRFARNRTDSMGYRLQLKRNGVHLVSILESYDPDSPEGILLESVLEGINEFYSRNLAREVEKGKKENALKGLHVGGKPPLGYDVDPKTRKLVINEYEAVAVRLIYRMFLEGATYSKIMTELNRQRFTSKNGTPFGINSLYNIMRNEKYTGVFIYSKSAPKDCDGLRNGHKYKSPDQIIRVEDAVPPIIQRKDFETVQELLIERVNRNGCIKAIETYLLSGKVQCGVCGSSFNGNRKRSRPDHPLYVQYRCSRHNRSVACGNFTLRREALESAVLEKLGDRIFNDALVPEILKGYSQYCMTRDAEGTKRSESIRIRLREVEREIKNLVVLIAKSGSAAMLEGLNILESEKAELDFELRRINKELSITDISEADIRKSFELAREMLLSGDLPTTRRLVERHIKKVIIFKDRIHISFRLGVDVDMPILDSAMPSHSRRASPQKKIPQATFAKSPAVSFKEFSTLGGGFSGGERHHRYAPF